MILKKNKNELKTKNYKSSIIYKKKNSIYIKASKKLIPKILKKKITNFKLNYFWNQSFDKNRLKIFVFWCFQNYGQNKTVKVLEILKYLGFQYATKAGLSLSIDDLIIPPTKSKLLIDAELITRTAMIQYKNAQITNLERFQKIIETWHITSEKMKDDMIHHFKTTNIFNPLYMMAFSGARGNISQVRQLVGMRGLMANPQGQILDFPIRSNFREGLTLTEYVISCYGARKGVVDTALRTANAGYLTRRLVDVAQHIIISNFDCETNRGLIVSEMKQGNKLLFSLRQRLLGRVLAKNVLSGNLLIARKNEEISDNLSEIIASFVKTVIIRSPLTCKTTQFICQRCYGWSLSEGKLVGVGETVGIIAAQSIGEPGTQLTMRTFHTGGVFAGELLDQFIAPFAATVKYNIYIPGNMIRTPQGTIAFLTRIESQLILQSCSNSNNKKYYTIPPYTILFIRNGETISKNQLVAQLCTFSPSLKNASNNLIEYKIYSDLEGEIKSTNLKVLKKITEMNDIMHRSLEWGYIWILSGKIYQLPFNSIDGLKIKATLQQKNNFFPIQGDFLTKSSILSQIFWINNIENIKLSFEQKTYFYDKFINNKKLSLTNCNDITNQWLKKWSLFSEIYCFTNLNNSIKKFNKNIGFLFQQSLINVYSHNLLLFLTINKIRYKKLGYLIIFKTRSKKISIKNLNVLKKIKSGVGRVEKNRKNSNFLVNYTLIHKNNNKDAARLNMRRNENKIFLSISLEYNTNQQNSLITSPNFFYQKQSNMFFELWGSSNESQFVGSGLITFSELFLFKNTKKWRQKRKKNQETHSTFQLIQRQLLTPKTSYQFYKYLKSYYVHKKAWFLYFFNNENKIKYLNSNYSIILFSFRPFIQCQKQYLSKFYSLKTHHSTLLYHCLSSLIKSILKKSIILRTNQSNIKYKYINYIKVFDIKKQFFDKKILQKVDKYNSNKYIRFNIHHKKIIIKLEQKNDSKLIKKIEFSRALPGTGKLQSFNLPQTDEESSTPLKKRGKTKRLKKYQYKSLKPLYFCYKIFNNKNNNFLLKKEFYNRLQLIMSFKNRNLFAYHNKQLNSFFITLSTNYLAKNLFFDFYQYVQKKKGFVKNIIIYQNFSNIFINLYNIQTTYKKNNLFYYKYILTQFLYINRNNIFTKQKLLRSKKFYSKNVYDKSKKIINIKNFKRSYSSFTYYIIKNQFRFAPAFQAHSVNQLENIYKKEIKNMSNYNIYKQKLLLIKQLNNNFLSCFIKERKRNISESNRPTFNTTNVVSLRVEDQNVLKKSTLKKLINQIEKSKEDFKNNKKSNKYVIARNNYLHFLFKQIIAFSNYMFNKKKKKQPFINTDYNKKKIENIQFNNYCLLHSIDDTKYVPILLIKYKKNNTTLNTLLLHRILIFKHFLIRKQSKDPSINITIVINDKDYLINNKINNFLLKMYLIKLNTLKNIVINYYFKLVSFKWLLIEPNTSLGKTKILHPVFLKRLDFSRFINKNIILSHDKSNMSAEAIKFDLIKQKKDKKKKFNKYSKKAILKKSKEKLLFYSRFSLVCRQYAKASKKQLSILISNSQPKILDNNYKILLKTNICFLYNLNNLSLLQKYLFYIKKIAIFNKKLEVKKTIKILTLKNFLNFKKIQTTLNIVSKKDYLKKTNLFIFNLYQIFYNKKFDILKINRQYEFVALNFKYSYGMLKFEKNKKKYSIFQLLKKKLSISKNIFYLSKQATIILNKKWQFFINKKEFIITNQSGWICKPIKNRNCKSDNLNISSKKLYHVSFIYKLLEKKLKFYHSNFIHSFHSIKILYKFCEKNLTWGIKKDTFLKMIGLVQNCSKYYNKEKNLLFDIVPSLSLLYSKFNLVKYNQPIKWLKNKKENIKKKNNYSWFINKKTRFIKIKEYNISIFKKNISKNEINNSNIDKIFCIVKVQEYFMNNYQNLSYFSRTNLLFLSRIKLLQIFEQKNKLNIRWNNNGLSLKSQYNTIFLNKQKLSNKLISKFPHLELTFEQHLNIPSNKLSHISHNETNCKVNLIKDNIILSTNKKILRGDPDDKLLTHHSALLKRAYTIFNKHDNILQFQKPIRIFRHFLGFSIPINFDFSFQSSNIYWNFFPNSNILKLKFEKKLNSTEFLTYLIFKNKILNKLEFTISPNDICLPHKQNSLIFINISNCLQILLRQPCIDWSVTQLLNIGYKKNIFFAPTKTFLLLSPQNYSSKNNPIALTKIYSGMKGEILYSLKPKKQTFDYRPLNSIESQVTETFLSNESFLKSERSLFLTKSDQICLKFKNEIILNNEFNFVKQLNIFQTNKHIRSLQIFQIKSVKQISIFFKVLQKIHNSCQFSNQSIQIDLGLFLFQGDLLNSFFTSKLRTNKKRTKTNTLKSIIVNHSGQIIHLNQYKLTVRKGQPIFFSPHCIFHSYNNDFIQQNKPVLSLPYQQLKTGDIVQGIPKIEQLFEARLTFAGKLEYDNLTNILEILFQTYQNKLQFKLAVRRSIELIQMIIINSIQRIYRSQGVNISDKHLEVIIKQMTKKVEIIDSAQSGFLIGEHFDLDVVELWNSKISKMKHVKYKPLILGISKASLQTDSFLSAASFQYTTRILSQAAFFKKRDFLKGLKENIIVGNIIPAGTGYLGNIEDLFKIN